MTSSNRLIALIVALTLCFGCLFSCNNGADTDDTNIPNDTPVVDTNDKTEENLQKETYKISVRVAFASDDEAMRAAIRKLNNPQGTATVIEVDKDNFRITSEAGVGGYNVSKTYTLVDGRLYHHSVIKSESQIASVREVTSLNDTDRDYLLVTRGEGAGIDISDFAMISFNKIQDGRCYECSNINEESARSLEKLFEAGFNAAEATIRLDSATYKLEIVKERNASSTLSCNFVVTMNDTDYTITMRMYYTYDYDAQISISAPTDADKYVEIPYTDIAK